MRYVGRRRPARVTAVTTAMAAVVALVALALSTVTAAAGPVTPAGAQAGPISLTVSPTENVWHQAPVTATVSGLAGQTVTVGWCDDRVLTEAPADTLCKDEQVVSGQDSATLTFTVGWFNLAAPDTYFRCGLLPGDCVVAVFHDGAIDASVPVSFAQTMVVTPDEGLVDGQRVTVAPGNDALHVQQCHRTGVEGDPIEALNRWCSDYARLDAATPPNTFVVRSSFTSYGGYNVDCGVVADDCFLLSQGSSSLATAPIQVAPSKVTVTTDDRDLLDGAVVDVGVHGATGAEATVAQCAAGDAGAVDPTLCGPSTAVALDAEGDGSVPFTVRAALDTPAGPVDCQAVACVLAGYDTGGTLLRAVPLPIAGRLAVTPEPDNGLIDGMHVLSQVTGIRSTALKGYLCSSEATGPEAIAGPCVEQTIGDVPAGTAPSSVWTVAARSFTGAGGQAVTCGEEPGDCVIAVGAPGSDQWASAPITFAELSLSPAGGYLDGQAVELTATGMQPGAQYQVQRCDPRPLTRLCDTLWFKPVYTVGPDGTLTVPVTAQQRFTSSPTGRPRYCHAECTLTLVARDGRQTSPSIGYAMAEGALTASPATGLSDGDTVTLTGTDLMPTYAGPAFWLFPSTGGWAIGQCGRGVVDDPTIYGVFAHCTVSGVAEVAGSTLTAEAPARASFTTILGTPVDCTAAPDACVMILGRVEQDGAVSIHDAPVSFA